MTIFKIKTDIYTLALNINLRAFFIYGILVLFTVFSCLSCKPDIKLSISHHDHVGIGLLEFSLDTLPVYRDKNATAPFDVIIFEKRSNGSYRFKSDMIINRMNAYRQYVGDTDEQAEFMVSSGLHGTGPSLTFIVLDTTSTGITVLLNNLTGETAFIRKEKHLYFNSRSSILKYYELNNNNAGNLYHPILYFESWKEYLKRVEYISLNDNSYKFNKPNGIALSRINNNDSHSSRSSRVIGVNNEWAQLSDSTWIKWHNDKQILIDIIEHSME